MRRNEAVAGQLVDARNAGQHKEAILKIAVPAETVLSVLEKLGGTWPTQVNPIPVAIVRLEPAGAGPDGHPLHPSTPPDACPAPPSKTDADKRLAKQAGMMCSRSVFQNFMIQEGLASRSDDVPEGVRNYCMVASRSEIIPGTPAADKWDQLLAWYERWLRE